MATIVDDSHLAFSLAQLAQLRATSPENQRRLRHECEASAS